MLAQTQRIKLDIPIVVYDLCHDISQISGDIVHPEKVAEYMARKISNVVFDSPDTHSISLTQMILDDVLCTHLFSRNLPKYIGHSLHQKTYNQYLNDLIPHVNQLIEVFRNRGEYAAVINGSFIFYRTNLNANGFQSLS